MIFMATYEHEYAVSFLIFEMSGGQDGHQFCLVDRLLVDVSSTNDFHDFMRQVNDGIRGVLKKPGMKAEIDMMVVRNKLVFLSSDLNQSDFLMPSDLSDVLASLEDELAADGLFKVNGTEIQRTDSPDLVERYENPPTVAVLLVETTTGLLVIRRGLKDGYGKLALPGGYQVKGETWQQAAAREVLEETGLALDPEKILIRDLVTVGEGSINLAFGQYIDAIEEFIPAHDSEVLSVERVNGPIETAFPTHTRIIESFYASKSMKERTDDKTKTP